MKKLAPSLLVTCLALLALAACVDNTRDPHVTTSGLPNIYKIEFVSDHRYYEFGEPVHLRTTLTNVSVYTLTFGNEAGTASVIDIRLSDDPSNERIWSQENQDQAKPVVILAPQESYIITWTVSLSTRADYSVLILWPDPAGYPPNANLVPGTISKAGTDILYGIQPPGPMP